MCMFSAQWKEASLKRLYNGWFQLYSILRKGKILKMVKRSVLSGARRSWVGWIGDANRIFEGSESILYDSVVVNIWHYAFVKIHWTLQHKEGNSVRTLQNYRSGSQEILGCNDNSDKITWLYCIASVWTNLMEEVREKSVEQSNFENKWNLKNKDKNKSEKSTIL